MNRLRQCEYVPAMPELDARQLERGGRQADADELRRRAAVLARTDELHQHASDLETIAGLYRALSILAGEHEVSSDDRACAQAGMLEEPMTVAHGPAFRETAALRNRAYRSLAASVARHARSLAASPP